MEPVKIDPTVFRPYKKLVTLTILGRQFAVPENNFLLRGFQYLCPESISYGRYCWNEECQYCRVTVSRDRSAKAQQAISCKLLVEEGMRVEELSAELRWNLRKILSPAREESSPPEDH